MDFDRHASATRTIYAAASKRRGTCAVGAALALGAAVLGGAGPASALTPPRSAAAASPPTVTIVSPVNSFSYERGARVVARFYCGAAVTPIVTCQGTVPNGRAIDTRSGGIKTFTVTATDASGNTVTKTVAYSVWSYVNPLRAVAALKASRIDMGVDYSGSGPILALGRATIVLASNRFGGPESCWGKTCVPPPGDVVIYRLLDGPFAGEYVYICEHITITVKTGQTVRAGQRIAILHEGSPNLEIGWASGHGVQTLAAAHRHQCACTDPGGWSSIEGLNFNALLVWLGAPSGYVTRTPPGQRMPRGWPRLPAQPPPR
jgi:murein DD-endopeptidase MepM/ murein hydrolase activator NlpD